MPNGILIFVEHRKGVLNKTSFEAVAAAQQLGASLGQTVSAVVLGTDASLAGEVAAYKLDKVVSVENPKLSAYTPELCRYRVGITVRRVGGLVWDL